MSENQDSLNESPSDFGGKTTAFICLLLILLGAGVILYIFRTEPRATRTEGTKTTAMLVDVTRADTGTFRPRIEAMGTVKPAQDIILRPRVSGMVIERSEKFIPGGFVDQGEVLVRLDPSDFKNALQQRESELSQTLADLKIEMGRQDVAEEEYKLFEETLTGENRALVLREPQLNAARAAVQSARAAVEQARLDMRRTEIRAPFDALILNRNVNRGSQVSEGDNLARLVGMDTYWVEATVPLSKLRWLAFPDTPGDPGSAVRIRNQTAWSSGEFRTGHLYKLIGEIEDETRMARVLISVSDPLAYRSRSSDSPALMIGSFVQTQIQGEKIPGVIKIDRDLVRKEDTVWVMKDDKLDIRPVEVVFRDDEHAYIRRGLAENNNIVTTNLTTVVDGAALRLKGTSGSPIQQTSSDTAPTP